MRACFNLADFYKEIDASPHPSPLPPGEAGQRSVTAAFPARTHRARSAAPSAACSLSMMQEILISLVVMFWMFTFASASALNMRCATPVCDAHADADDADLRQVAVVDRRASCRPAPCTSLSTTGLMSCRSPCSTVKLMLAVLSSITFWMMSSTTMLAVGDVAEDLGGDAGAVGDALDRDAGQVFLQRGAGYDDVFHVRCLRDDPGAFVVVLAVAHVDRDVVLLGKLDGPGLQHARPEAGQLEHLVVADAVDLARRSSRCAGRR